MAYDTAENRGIASSLLTEIEAIEDIFFNRLLLFLGRWEGKDHKIIQPFPDDGWFYLVCWLQLLIINLNPAAGTSAGGELELV